MEVGVKLGALERVEEVRDRTSLPTCLPTSLHTYPHLPPPPLAMASQIESHVSPSFRSPQLPLESLVVVEIDGSVIKIAEEEPPDDDDEETMQLLQQASRHHLEDGHGEVGGGVGGGVGEAVGVRFGCGWLWSRLWGDRVWLAPRSWRGSRERTRPESLAFEIRDYMRTFTRLELWLSSAEYGPLEG